jgi:hypothetical protein
MQDACQCKYTRSWHKRCQDHADGNIMPMNKRMHYNVNEQANALQCKITANINTLVHDTKDGQIMARSYRLQYHANAKIMPMARLVRMARSMAITVAKKNLYPNFPIWLVHNSHAHIGTTQTGKSPIQINSTSNLQRNLHACYTKRPI